MTRIAHNSTNSILGLFLLQPCYTLLHVPHTTLGRMVLTPSPFLRYLIEKREWALKGSVLVFLPFFAKFSHWAKMITTDVLLYSYQCLDDFSKGHQSILFKASGVYGPMPFQSNFFSSSPFFQPVHSSHFEYWYCYVFIFVEASGTPRSSRQPSGAS